MPHAASRTQQPNAAPRSLPGPIADGKFHLIATVAEAAQYLTRLPRRYDGLVWAAAGNALEHADQPYSHALSHATDAFAVALDQDDLLVLAVPA